ncbi:E3 ubiquitin-protein ligase BRE1-like 2 [Camellia lanceoleosa]|uniref:E3 ubiquitin-protein ligase BRE1-like 2 n=1 Tax=Camellia lanceoleosa TaxID=1840588 RepID=A0ACC0FQY2_9ERIC|nr:E3 ubiquitin-protein ligase BRE1-like 2 [Camellia lanceoleosa]
MRREQEVDAAVLQYQNQKLVQQLDVQKHELHDLDAKIKELKDQQASYDNKLITVNQLWNQLVDDLILLGVRAGAHQNALQTLDRVDHSRGSIPSCSAEEIFLCRLLETDSIETSRSDGSLKYIQEALDIRISSTWELMKFLEDTIYARRAKIESIAQAWHGNASAEDAIIQLSKVDDLMKEETSYLNEVIDVLHLKHKDYADGIQAYIHSHSVDQSEIHHLAGELEESMAELEESRRKLVNLKMQKDVASGVHTPVVGAVNGSLSPEKTTEKTIHLRELKDSIEETKILAADRLSELQDAQEDNLTLSKQLQDLQDELKDEKYVYSSRLYTLLNDQLQHWNNQVERYKGLTDSLQADRSTLVRREKEFNIKIESLDAARNAVDNAESEIEELELQLQKCIMEKNELDIKMEEAVQDSGRKDIKAEFHVMASALSKEMGMMEAQLNRGRKQLMKPFPYAKKPRHWKLYWAKSEQTSLADKCAEHTAEIKSLKTLRFNGNQRIGTVSSQAEHLRNALDEHGLELRVKAANEAEAACQQRLSAAEAEIADLRGKLDASDRDVLELKEAVKIKDGESEAYISEIETIGQAYEDMQTQNQHLLQQVAERDDYNIKLVSESVKTKQAQSFLLSEKQELAKQFQQVNTTLESLKLRIADSEEQMKVCIDEALKSTQEDRHLAVNLENAKWELADAEKELKWLKSAVSSSEKECEQIQRKMDEIQMELDSERSERKKLDEELMELNMKLVSESVKTKQAQRFLLSEKQELAKKFQQVNTTLESLKLRIADSEEQMKVCIDETLKSTQEDRHLAVNLEIAKWELADAEKELKWLKSAVSSSEKECEQIQRKMDEIQMEQDSERC